MPKQIIIAEQHQVAAVYWEDQIQELVVATGNQQVSDIYLGLVENVIPGIDAAFVNIGDAERNGFIHVTDLGPLRLKKTAGAITELLVPQQKVLVQVMKEPTGNKGPRLTGNISLPGRYLVLIPNGKGVNLSRRIRNDEERSRLRALAILTKPPGMGLLVRTEAEGKGEDAILEDLEFLQKQWEMVQQQAVSTRAPALLNRDDDFIQRVLRDMYSSDVNRIVTDTQAGVKRVKQHLMSWSEGRAPEGVVIDYHREPQNILDYFRVNAAIREALKPRVDLPSGGYVIIEPTEALTVIDVNSGSFTRSATARETVLWTNSEAATEIARQLRLRNIGGVIIVDFIDMDSRRDQLKLLEHFNRSLKFDKARPQIAQLSELGLVELTRKRQGKNIYELFGSPCPTCGGLGHLAELPGEVESVSLESPILSPPSSTPRIIERPVVDPVDVSFESSFDYEGSESASVQDLLYHPDYLDKGGAQGNRRRRRRRGTENLGKEEAPAKVLPNLVNKTVEPDIESDIETRKERQETGRASRGSGTISSTTRLPRREEVPPERVSVELTPLEQDVYALMGVSPLIRLDQEFKDPKSVIVSIKTKGESALPDSEVQSEIQEGILSPVETSLPSLDNDIIKLKPEILTLTRRQRTSSVSSGSDFSGLPVVEEAEVDEKEMEFKEPMFKEEMFKEEIEPPIVRRRRRRSSAQEDW